MGNEIQKQMEKDGRKSSWLAKKIECDVSKIYRIYHQQYVDIETLIAISILLEINFFSYYFKYVEGQLLQKNNKK